MMAEYTGRTLPERRPASAVSPRTTAANQKRRKVAELGANSAIGNAQSADTGNEHEAYDAR